MDVFKKTAGILGIAGAGLFIIAAAVSVLLFEDGVYSPANCFVTELGLYTGGYMSVSTALIFNIGMIVSGLAFVAFMVMRGMSKSTNLTTAVSFFGIWTGVLLAALGIFSLNFSQYHYILTIAFFIAVFITCALYIVSEMVTSNAKGGGLVKIIVAFAAGITGIVFTGYMFTGGMAQVFYEDARKVGRLGLLPFALIEWISFLLLFALFVILAVDMLKESRASAKEQFGDKVFGKDNIVAEPKKAKVKEKVNTMEIEL